MHRYIVLSEQFNMYVIIWSGIVKVDGAFSNFNLVDKVFATEAHILF